MEGKQHFYFGYFSVAGAANILEIIHLLNILPGVTQNVIHLDGLNHFSKVSVLGENT